MAAATTTTQDGISKSLTKYKGIASEEKQKKLLYLNLFNSAPCYITFPELFLHSFKDATLARDLIAHLEANSANSCLDVTKDTVVECDLYETITEEKNAEQMPLLIRVEEHLRKVINVINTFIQHNGPIQYVDSWGDVIWIRKYTPSLLKKNDKDEDDGAYMHYDYNVDYHLEENNKNYSTPDLASLIVTLNDGDEYTGGENIISDGFHKQTGSAQFKALPKSNSGEGILWDGWTLHGVNPVTSGVRYIMAVHFRGKLKDGKKVE